MFYQLINIFKIHIIKSLLFHCALKPFLWPHPMVFSVSNELMNLFDAPVPIIVGMNKDFTYIRNNNFD